MAEIKLASRLDALNESATLALNAKAQQLMAEGKTIYNLTAGELATDTPDYIQQAVASNLSKNKYTPVAGLSELREAIALHARQFYGLDWIKNDHVVLTAGAKPALYAALMSLINPGDEVIVPAPAWLVSYRPLIELAGGMVVEVPLNESFDLDIQAISDKITSKTRAIILNSPSNPTGAVYSKGELEKLKVILQNRDITIIADDIYTKLFFDSEFTSVPSIGFEKLVIINGFSKSQALTGWRIGYLIADAPVSQSAVKLLSHITGNAPLPSQYAALAAMERDDQPPAQTIEDLKIRRELVSKLLDEANIKYVMPNGAFYFLLDLRPFTDDSGVWCERLLTSNGVALVPGEAFGAPGFARLTFVADKDTLTKALKQISEFVRVGQ